MPDAAGHPSVCHAGCTIYHADVSLPPGLGCRLELLPMPCTLLSSPPAFRRDQLLQDSFAQLNAMGPDRLKGRLRIAYVNEAGAAEAGIDGGGLFKDFMEELLKKGFSPQVRARA